MKILETMNLSDAKALLKDMKVYLDMTKKLGSRGSFLFKKNISWDKSFVVEYFPALGEDSAWAQAQNVFSKSFSVSPDKKDVVFTENSTLKGWMKVYVDDDMVDLSYKKIENLMQK